MPTTDVHRASGWRTRHPLAYTERQEGVPYTLEHIDIVWMVFAYYLLAYALQAVLYTAGDTEEAGSWSAMAMGSIKGGLRPGKPAWRT